MIEWILNETPNGATYLQVIIIIALLLIVVIPIAYINARDTINLTKSTKRSDSLEDSE